MNKKILSNYKKAGSAWEKGITFAQKKAKEGVKLLELAEKTEALVLEETELAFPLNLSINSEAAHFTPKWNDEAVLKESDLLKIDLGVSVNGYVCDGAVSINLDNSHAKQIEANALALKNAISLVKHGQKIDVIGEEIEKTLKAKGFNPIYNLGGHGLEQYDIHASPSIPNHSKGNPNTLKEEAIALEPFASTGKGFVGEGTLIEIFAKEKEKGIRNPYARKILSFVEKYNGLPFTERWIRKESGLSEFQVGVGLREIMKAECFETFPGLKEEKGVFVSQFEQSIIVLENETIVLGEKAKNL